MIEFLKCLWIGLAFFASIGVLVLLINLALNWNPEVVAWSAGIVLGLALAWVFGASWRGDR